MSKVLVTESHLGDIADAIRAKNGSADTYRPGDMAAAIAAIPSGGITPTGTINITQNGTVDVTNYASASVNVSGGGGNTVKLKVGPYPMMFNFLINDNYGPMLNGGATQYIIPVDSNGAAVAPDATQPFEVCCTFQLTNSPGTQYGRNIFGSISNYWSFPAISVLNGKFEGWFTTTSGRWTNPNIAITGSGYTVPKNTDITAKITYDGTTYTFSIDDGTVQASATRTGVTSYCATSNGFCFGSQANSTQYSIAQSGAIIKMSNTYIKQNGVLLWGVQAS